MIYLFPNGNLSLIFSRKQGCSGCKTIDNPVAMNVEFGESSESPQVEKGRYQGLVGKLIPDIND
jgi:hypothetical protein